MSQGIKKESCQGWFHGLYNSTAKLRGAEAFTSENSHWSSDPRLSTCPTMPYATFPTLTMFWSVFCSLPTRLFSTLGLLYLLVFLPGMFLCFMRKLCTSGNLMPMTQFNDHLSEKAFSDFPGNFHHCTLFSSFTALDNLYACMYEHGCICFLIY